MALGCAYCLTSLTVKTFTPDHAVSLAQGGSWDLDNQVLSCQSCNWQKGKMSGEEFRRLLEFLAANLAADSASDVKRRLSIGGKWSWK
jgi:5-methylcytosine-specific restriction endonuclease McrA